MTKKLDFLRDQQSRQKHPDKHQIGSPADLQAQAARQCAPLDPQEPGAGKIANDHNKTSHQPPSQTNEGRRTPQSRHDRETLGPGPQNQVAARKGGGGAGRTPRGGG